MGVTSAVCAVAVSAPAAFGVRGVLPVADDTVRTVILLVVGCGLLCGLLEASPLRRVGLVRDFDAAVPLKDPEGVLPADYSLGPLLFNWRFVPVMVVPALVVGLTVNPWLALAPLTMALDWLMRAAIAARWERKHAALLWREHIQSTPWELSYTPLGLPSARTTVGTAPE
ncbi:hypothetical protein F0344_34040 [Streptomyces finlayi]|uniref:Uncharacterized protein n=1 Tax=Streptomyces finlayi TaxID=67296 RepID=A0A7G7BUC9_9ACTN|nr:hypothetical protein [Streptomyces finlayi]QNE78944.1 hypothetical protein F0344_34040 [Streptomyces finlayi]